MTVKRLFIDEAHKQALKSDMNFNHGAVLIYRGKIIGRGYNTYINDNYDCKKKISLHAEVSAINDALKKIHYEDLKKCELRMISHNYHIEMKKIKLFDVVLFNRKQQYLTHYKKLKTELTRLKNGLQNNQFIV
jgi:deoxycytidylate deaminase